MKIKRSSYRRTIARALAGTALVFSGVAMITPALAQETRGEVATYDVPAGPLGTALAEFAKQSGYQLLYPSDLVAGRSTAGFSGQGDTLQALAKILAGTGLTFRLQDGKTIQIEAAVAAGDSERVLGAVRVQGSQGTPLAGATEVNGINGSRDVTATEGTGSYTTGAMTIGSKMAATIREVPRAVSVLTSQQMEDQVVTNITDAMKALPGVIAQNETSGRPTFYSRGFEITTFQIDGGAPLQTNPKRPNGGAINGGATGAFVANMDMSLYDHVELIRGAAGTFNGYGNPGGIVNLVRKRPLDHSQLLLEFQLGSYDLHRVSADVTGPLAFDGRLRGRIIATHQDNNFFYSLSDNKKSLVSVTLEYDLTPTTLLSAGATYDEQQMTPWYDGLMRDMKGNLVPVSRTTCLCRPGVRFNIENPEYFGQLEQKIGQDWLLKYKVTYINQKQDSIASTISGVYNEDPNKSQVTAYNWSWEKWKQRRVLQEATLDGSFSLFGLKQKIVAGISHSISWANLDTFYGEGIRGWQPIDPVHYDPSSENYAFNGSWSRDVNLVQRIQQFNAYINADLNIFQGLHFLIGANVVKAPYKSKTDYYCAPDYVLYGICESNQVGKIYNTYKGKESGKTRISWPPSTSVRFDISKYMSAYATYADIRIEQSSFLVKNGGPIDPIVGGNFEGGVKLSPNQGKIDISLSGYYISQKGFASRACHDAAYEQYDWYAGVVARFPAVCSRTGTGGSGSTYFTECCYISNPDKKSISYGLDLEINGEIRRGWQLSASYTFNRNINHDPDQLDNATNGYAPLLSFSPRHLYKLWTSYDFSEHSNFNGLSIYAGLQGQSKTFTSDSYCSVPVTANGDCPVSRTPVHYISPAWVIVNLGGAYKVNKNLSVQLNVDNVFDKQYLASVGGLAFGSFYGSPRSFSLTLRSKF